MSSVRQFAIKCRYIFHRSKSWVELSDISDTAQRGAPGEARAKGNDQRITVRPQTPLLRRLPQRQKSRRTARVAITIQINHNLFICNAEPLAERPQQI